MYRNVLTIAALLIAVGGAAMLLSWIKPAGVVKLQSRGDVDVVEATQIASAFEAAEDRAMELYSGKRARIRGQFARSESLADGNLAVTFKTSIGTFRPVRCIFHGGQSSVWNQLSSGGEINVTGRIDGFTESRYFITVDDCVVE